MRELKFRAWDKLDKEFTHNIDCLLDISVAERVFVLDDEGGELIIEQYTGLRDRGVEIYEGDIIRWANSVGREITAPVVWNTRAWCWTAGDYMLGGLLEFDLEVIGNIHENPELLEAKQ